MKFRCDVGMCRRSVGEVSVMSQLSLQAGLGSGTLVFANRAGEGEEDVLAPEGEIVGIVAE